MPARAWADRSLWHLPHLAAIGFILAACSSGPQYGNSGALVPHPTYKIGAPYEVKGVWYHPKVDYDYDETGTASWYGEQFQGRYTANGEVYDLNQLTAAHKTLPLPSIVELTNLRTGRALRLRVNDRGPFVKDRIIDVSRHTAQLLGFERSGTTQVRVRILKAESIRAAELAKRGIVEDRSSPIVDALPTPQNAPVAANPNPALRQGFVQAGSLKSPQGEQ